MLKLLSAVAKNENCSNFDIFLMLQIQLNGDLRENPFLSPSLPFLI